MSEAIFPGTTPTLSFVFPDEIVPQNCQKIALILSQNGRVVFSRAETPPTPNEDDGTGTVESGPIAPQGAVDGIDGMGGLDPMSPDPQRNRFVINGQTVSITLRQDETREFMPCFSLSLELWVKTASGAVPDPWQTSIPVGIVQDSGAV